MFINLWTGLRDLYHDNKTTASRENAKRFINWSIQDIANEYDWEFLRGDTTLSPSANIQYDLSNITRITNVSANIYAIADASADDGVIVTVHGSIVNNALDTITFINQDYSVSAGVSASGGVFSDIDYISKPVTTGTVYITDGTNIICTLSDTDTYVANDIRKINKIVNPANNEQVFPIDWSTQLEGNPTSTAVDKGYDFVGDNKIRFFGATGSQYSIIFQRKPRWLIHNNDRTEFPVELHQDIIQYAYRIYGKQYQDEATQIGDTMIDDLKKMLIGNIIRKWSGSADNKAPRILPRGYKRAV
jgi:hypothetical protein